MSFGQQIVVDKRGTGIVAIEIAAKAAADGYTALRNGSTLLLMRFLHEKLSCAP